MVDLDQLGSDDKRSVRDVAEAFLAWAKQKNLFDKTPLEDGLDQDEVDYDVTSNEFLAQATETILRKRSVNLVGFSEPERKIIVFTHSKVSKSDEKTLPFKFGECTVEYAQGGIAQVKGNPPPPQNPQPYILRGNHYTCGSSVFPAHCIGAGTLGLIVKDNQGKLYGLSNNHVTGACNNAMPGLPILAPGPLDATENACDPFTVGRHSSLLPINDGIPENIDISENCDASLFELSDSSKVTSYQGNYFDTPQTTAIPIPSMKVKKVVRTTGLTLGTIVAQSASPVPVSYAVTEYGVKKTVWFNDVYIVVGDGGVPFSRSGDSGSLVVSTNWNGTELAVGLVFAGNEQRGISFILPLTPILQRLDVEVVSKHNVT